MNSQRCHCAILCWWVQRIALELLFVLGRISGSRSHSGLQAFAGVTAPVARVQEVQAVCARTSLFVAAAEVLLQHRLERVHRSPANSIELSANCEAVLSALSSELPGLELPHIAPSAVVEGDMLHIFSLLELLADLTNMSQKHLQSHAEVSNGAAYAGTASCQADSMSTTATPQAAKAACAAAQTKRHKQQNVKSSIQRKRNPRKHNNMATEATLPAEQSNGCFSCCSDSPAKQTGTMSAVQQLAGQQPTSAATATTAQQRPTSAATAGVATPTGHKGAGLQEQLPTHSSAQASAQSQPLQEQHKRGRSHKQQPAATTAAAASIDTHHALLQLQAALSSADALLQQHEGCVAGAAGTVSISYHQQAQKQGFDLGTSVSGHADTSVVRHAAAATASNAGVSRQGQQLELPCDMHAVAAALSDIQVASAKLQLLEQQFQPHRIQLEQERMLREDQQHRAPLQGSTAVQHAHAGANTIDSMLRSHKPHQVIDCLVADQDVAQGPRVVLATALNSVVSEGMVPSQPAAATDGRLLHLHQVTETLLANVQEQQRRLMQQQQEAMQLCQQAEAAAAAAEVRQSATQPCGTVNSSSCSSSALQDGQQAVLQQKAVLEASLQQICSLMEGLQNTEQRLLAQQRQILAAAVTPNEAAAAMLAGTPEEQSRLHSDGTAEKTSATPGVQQKSMASSSRRNSIDRTSQASSGKASTRNSKQNQQMERPQSAHSALRASELGKSSTSSSTKQSSSSNKGAAGQLPTRPIASRTSWDTNHKPHPRARRGQQNKAQQRTAVRDSTGRGSSACRHVQPECCTAQLQRAASTGSDCSDVGSWDGSPGVELDLATKAGLRCSSAEHHPGDTVDVAAHQARATSALTKVAVAKAEHDMASQRLWQQQVLKQHAATARRLQMQMQQQQVLDARQQAFDTRVSQLQDQRRSEQDSIDAARVQRQAAAQQQAVAEAAEAAGAFQWDDTHQQHEAATAHASAMGSCGLPPAAAKAACRLKGFPARSSMTASLSRQQQRRLLRQQQRPGSAAAAGAEAAAVPLQELQTLRHEYQQVLGMFEDLLVTERRGRMAAERLLAQLVRQQRVESRQQQRGWSPVRSPVRRGTPVGWMS